MPLNGSDVASKPANTTAVPNTTIQSTPFNSVIDDIYAILNTVRSIAKGFTGATSEQGAIDNFFNGSTVVDDDSLRVSDPSDRTKIARFDSGLISTGTTRVFTLPDRDINLSGVPRGAAYGLSLSNSVSDSVNDIDISSGEAASDSVTPYMLVLGSAITKRLDASWAVGTGNGGLDTGAVANGIYYVWLIQRSDTGVVDALFSTSNTSPTMPTNYDRKRLLGSFARVSGTNKAPRTYSVDVTEWTAYTPTFTGLGTPSNVVFRSRRNGGSLEGQFQFTTGTATNVTAVVTLGFGGTNSNVTIDSAWNSTRLVAGPAVPSSAISASYYVLAIGGDGSINFGAQSGGAGGLSPITGLGGIGSGVVIGGSFSVPIQGWN